MKAGTAIPTTKDYMRVEAARKNRAATSTESARRISMELSDPQLVGMATDGITDAAYQATYRTCMRRNGFDHGWAPAARRRPDLSEIARLKTTHYPLGA